MEEKDRDNNCTELDVNEKLIRGGMRARNLVTSKTTNGGRKIEGVRMIKLFAKRRKKERDREI